MEDSIYLSLKSLPSLANIEKLPNPDEWLQNKQCFWMTAHQLLSSKSRKSKVFAYIDFKMLHVLAIIDGIVANAPKFKYNATT